MMMSPSVSSSRRGNAKISESPGSQRMFGQQIGNLKDLLALINAHTDYPSSFLPITVQAEPIIDQFDFSTLRQQRSNNGKYQTLPQLKAKFEFELMHSSAVLFLADTSAVRRFDFQMPEQLRFSSFTLEKIQSRHFLKLGPYTLGWVRYKIEATLH